MRAIVKNRRVAAEVARAAKAARLAREALRPVPRPVGAAPAPSPLAGALSAIEGVGWVLADAMNSGEGLDAASCRALVDDMRKVYRVVRALRPAA